MQQCINSDYDAQTHVIFPMKESRRKLNIVQVHIPVKRRL